MQREAEINSILEQVEPWPDDDRIALAYKLLQRKANGSVSDPKLKPSIDHFAGIARGTGPAPTDAQVREWIAEYRLKKYG